MAAQMLDGRALAQSLQAALKAEAKQFAARHKRAAHLALFVAGADAGAAVFGRQVQRAARAMDIATSLTTFAPDVAEPDMRKQIARASDDPATDGVVVLLPLPEGVRQRVVTEVIAPTKDVDGLGPRNAGNLMLGFPSFVPGTAEAALELLHHAGLSLRGRHAVVVGRSNVGGKPVALQFLRHDATITVCHSHTHDLADITRSADILFVSTGRAEAITGAMVKPGAVVLDAGINRTPQGIAGDVHFASVSEVAGWLTPVPGGLGPLTHLMVLRHTLLGPTP
jgi:methylenetetrahydrofolate dehydrogenase (NADP+) / methenyltetrahydrofolate cyclohydrolase